MTVFTIFLNVILPVVGVVLIGYLIGERLDLQARTLSRTAYYVFVPAFIFQAIGGSRLPYDQALRIFLFILATHLLAALITGFVSRILGLSRVMTAAFIMIAVAGNVGNFGLAMIRFRLGDEALASATLYYVTISITAFVVSVGAAGWAHGGRKGAFWGVLKTPAIWAVIPALLVSNTGLELPLMMSRLIGLLADAMIPVMLFTLGLQLYEQKRIELTLNVFVASSIRLVLVPSLAVLVAFLFRVDGLDFSSGVLQAGMPTAVVATIIARENDLAPQFVTSVLLVTVLASLVTLPVLMLLLG